MARVAGAFKFPLFPNAVTTIVRAKREVFVRTQRNVVLPQDTNIGEHRQMFIDTASRCAVNRYEYFPEVLCRPPKALQNVLVWGLRPTEQSIGVHVAPLAAKLQRNSDLKSLGVTGFHPTGNGEKAAQRYRSYEDFFLAPEDPTTTLIVDRSVTWRHQTPDWTRLQELGFSVVRWEQFLNAPVLDGEGYYREHSDYLLDNVERLLGLAASFADSKSQCVFFQSLAGLIAMDYRFFHSNLNPNEYRYVPEDIDRPFGDSEVFIDCGAFDGTDSQNFIRRTDMRYRSVHIFEPDARNFCLTTDRMNAFSQEHELADIYIYRTGVSDQNSYVSFHGDGQAVAVHGKAISSGAGLFLARLDDMVEDATWIKLEVEGSELAALKGASALIARRRPTISVSMYHRPTDFLEIVPYLNETLSGYRMYLRHSGLEPGTLCLTAVPNS